MSGHEWITQEPALSFPKLNREGIFVQIEPLSQNYLETRLLRVDSIVFFSFLGGN